MRVFGFEVKERYRRPAGVRVGPPDYGYGHINRTYAFEDEAINRVPVVYACINHIAGQIGMLPRRVVDSNDKAVPSPAWLERPNGYMSGTNAVHALVNALLIYGDAFIIPERLNGKVTSLHFPHPINMRPDGNYTNKTRWRLAGKEFEGEFYHIRYHTAADTVLGLGPMSALRRLIQVSDGTLEYMASFIDRGGAYQLILSAPDTTTPDVIEDNLAQIHAHHAGPGNAYRPLMLGGGIDVKPVSQTNTDAGYLDMRTMTDAQVISYGFNLDPNEFGINSGADSLTYRNEPGRWYRTWQRALRPIVHLLEENLSLLLPPNRRVVFDKREFLIGGPHDRGRLISSLAVAQMQWANSNNGEQLFSRDEIRELGGFTD